MKQDKLAQKLFLPEGTQRRKIGVIRPTCLVHMLAHDVRGKAM